MTERFPRHDAGAILQHLDKRNIGRRALPHIAVPHDGEAATPGRLRQDGSRYVSLTDSRLATEEGERAMAGQGGVETAQQLGSFHVAPDHCDGRGGLRSGSAMPLAASEARSARTSPIEA